MKCLIIACPDLKIGKIWWPFEIKNKTKVVRIQSAATKMVHSLTYLTYKGRPEKLNKHAVHFDFSDNAMMSAFFLFFE